MQHLSGESQPRPRGKFRRAQAAVRSVLRRYPPEFVASLMKPKAEGPRAFRDILTELAPHDLAACWLGHGSVVISIGDFTFAVDPVLSERIGPMVGKRIFGLSRQTPIPFSAGSLRGLDAILITHAHFDHLDKATLRQLADSRTTVVVPPRCRRLIPHGYADVKELAPGNKIDLKLASIAAMQPRHWGARTLVDRRRGACAYVVRHNDGSVLGAGDTGFTQVFDGIGDIDLAVFGIGAYNPWEHMHATPEQVWQMFRATGARYLLPVHHSTFELSDEPPDEPMQRLRQAAADARESVIEELPGEVVIIPTEPRYQSENE